jgi:hypothetical protein
MKRIIDGKRYDTDTATRIAAAESSCNPGDFHYWAETLYMTKKGAFFMQGEGGALSRWSEPVGSNGRGGGSGIRPMTETEAREWCEANSVDADRIAEFFEVIDA